MPLQAPILDDRTFEQLVAEARSRIPRFTPEWTNFNDSDPGMTLVQLHAWLTETILYRLNRLPDLNYIKFLDLLNITPRPAAAATSQLTFKLKKLNDPFADPLTVVVPKNTQVGVNDPDLPQELIFETDRTLTALNGTIAAVITPGTGSQPNDLATDFDAQTGEVRFDLPFYPFGRNPAAGDTCLIGIVLRPQRQPKKNYTLDRMPEGELDITVFVPQVFETDAEAAVITGPQGMACLFPWEAAVKSQDIAWEAYIGTSSETDFLQASAWRELSVLDETAALTRSGHVHLDVPGGLPVIAFSRLSREFWANLGLAKPPTTAEELAADVDGSSGLEVTPENLDKAAWQKLGLSGAALDSLCAVFADPAATPQQKVQAVLSNAGAFKFSALEESAWVALGYHAAPVPFPLTWYRGRLLIPAEDPQQVSEFRLNTVSATAAVTRVQEVLDPSNGRPNQARTLRRAPVLIDPATGQPDVTITVSEPSGDAEEWQRVNDFYLGGAGAAVQNVFTLDPGAGTITFGDGVHGRIPGAGAEIIATRYRSGGGSVGNAGAGTITNLKSALPDVDSVANLRAAQGGSDAETLDDVTLRAPHTLRTQERAVTADDFAELALRTPGVRIQRAFALPTTRANLSTSPPTLIPNSAGAVTVVILPENKDETPQPGEDQLRLVCAHLSDRRLITTELYVVGPRYRDIGKLEMDVTVGRQYDLKVVHDQLTARLLEYFHPLRGGEDGQGWPFGQDIFFGNVYRQALAIDGVRRVLCLEITAADGAAACDDVLNIPDGWLVHLPRPSLNVKVRYDQGA
jgi:hypothetical protein